MARDRVGVVKLTQGDTRIIGKDSVSRVPSPGAPVMLGDQVVTGEGAALGLVMDDNSRLTVGPSSRIEFKQFTFEPTTREGNFLVSLLRGSLRLVTGLIGHLRPESERVETPTAVIGVRGTDFIVQVDGRP